MHAGSEEAPDGPVPDKSVSMGDGGDVPFGEDLLPLGGVARGDLLDG